MYIPYLPTYLEVVVLLCCRMYIWDLPTYIVFYLETTRGSSIDIYDDNDNDKDNNNNDNGWQCWYIAVDTLSTLGSLFSSIPPHCVVRDSGMWGDWQVTSPFAALPLAWQRSIKHHRRGREREFISIPPLPSIPSNNLIPSVGLIGPPSSFILLFLRTSLRWN